MVRQLFDYVDTTGGGTVAVADIDDIESGSIVVEVDNDLVAGDMVVAIDHLSESVDEGDFLNITVCFDKEFVGCGVGEESDADVFLNFSNTNGSIVDEVGNIRVCDLAVVDVGGVFANEGYNTAIVGFPRGGEGSGIAFGEGATGGCAGDHVGVAKDVGEGCTDDVVVFEETRDALLRAHDAVFDDVARNARAGHSHIADELTGDGDIKLTGAFVVGDFREIDADKGGLFTGVVDGISHIATGEEDGTGGVVVRGDVEIGTVEHQGGSIGAVIVVETG